MMRVPDHTTLRAKGSLSAASALALMAALGLLSPLSQPLAAQSTFSLPQQPTPTPTATGAPQGPVDERAGVQIGPRVIRQTPAATPTPTPAQAPAQAAPTPQQAAPTTAPNETVSQPSAQTSSPQPARTSRQTAPSSNSPTPAATPTPAPARSVPTRLTRTITSRPAPTAPALPAPTQTVAPTPAASDLADTQASGTEVALGDRIDPGFESLGEEGETLAPVGADDWYSVDRDGDAASADAFDEAGTGAPASPASTAAPLIENDDSDFRLIIAGALFAGLLATLIGMVWWRRRREANVQEIPNTVLASGVLRSIPGRQMASESVPPEDDGADDEAEAEPEPQPKPEPEPKPAPEPAPEAESEPEAEAAQPPAPTAAPPARAEPAAALRPQAAHKTARIDLELDIPVASRSMMMFMIEFSLEVANRSDHALRDVTIAGNLVCARKGSGNSAPIAGGQPIGTIERIAPQQSRRITGQLQLPLTEVSAIRQGSKPLFIPLLHFTLEGQGLVAVSHSFVLGTPSASSSSRVHPLPLDGPPGSLPPMRAQPLKQTFDQSAGQSATGDPQPA